MNDVAAPPLLILDRYALSWAGDLGPEGPRRPDKKPAPGDEWKYHLDSEGIPLCPLARLTPGTKTTWMKAFDYDAHTTMYHVPGEEYCPRIKKEAVRKGLIEPVLGWIIIDVDTPDHVDLDDAPIAWIEQVLKAESTVPELAHALRWASKGGYKYAWPLTKDRQYPVRKGEDYLRMFIDYLTGQGLPVDEACKDWTRLMRLPNARRDGDPKSGQYKVFGFGTLTPLDWTPPREPVEGGLEVARAKRTPRAVQATDPLLLRVREALHFVPADTDYSTWLNVGIALRVSFQDLGFSVWQDWSKKATDQYPGDAALQQKWAGLPDAPMEGGLSIRSIFRIAREHGWQDRMNPEDALDIVRQAHGFEEYYSHDALTAAATLRENRGAEWSLIVKVVQDDPTAPRFKDWESAVSARQREMEIARKEAEAQVREAELLAQKAENSAPITNFERDFIDGQEVRYRKELGRIIEDVRKRTAGWPRMMDNVPFSVDLTLREPIYFPTAGQLFAWLELETGMLEWSGREMMVENGGAVQPVTKDTAFHGLQYACPDEHRYKTVETIPHVPPVPDAYYFPRELPAPTGKVLDRFCSLLNPATPEDGCLLRAMIYTGMAGLAPGKRPAFVITSDAGRGAGKTSTAQAIANIYGGVIGVSASDGWGRLQERLLDPSTTSKRYCLIDNIKNSLGSADFEGAITAEKINGKRMYVGDGERINHLTWIFTANSPALSNDLAERAVKIKIGEADHSIDFESEIRDILENHCDQLLADIKGELEAPARGMVDANWDRWQAWQRMVLSRFENADALAALIDARRKEMDDDSAQAEQWAEHIEELLKEHKHHPDKCKVVIPSQQMVTIARKVEADATLSYRESWSILRNVIGVGAMKTTRQHRGYPCRGLYWLGKDADPDQEYEDFGRPENPVNWSKGHMGAVERKEQSRERKPEFM